MSIKELKQLEKKYFDTYKNNKTSKDKANYLEKMVVIIRQIQKIEKNGTCETKKKSR